MLRVKQFFQQYDNSMDLVAMFGNKVECCFNKVRTLLRHCCWCGQGFTSWLTSSLNVPLIM